MTAAGQRASGLSGCPPAAGMPGGRPRGIPAPRRPPRVWVPRRRLRTAFRHPNTGKPRAFASPFGFGCPDDGYGRRSGTQAAGAPRRTRARALRRRWRRRPGARRGMPWLESATRSLSLPKTNRRARSRSVTRPVSDQPPVAGMPSSGSAVCPVMPTSASATSSTAPCCVPLSASEVRLSAHHVLDGVPRRGRSRGWCHLDTQTRWGWVANEQPRRGWVPERLR